MNYDELTAEDRKWLEACIDASREASLAAQIEEDALAEPGVETESPER